MGITKRARQEARELFRGCIVNNLLDEDRVRRTVQYVVAAGRHDGPAILAHFRQLLKLELARRTATIESATPLPADVRVAVEAGLTRLYGPGLSTALADRPALIGGVGHPAGREALRHSVPGPLGAVQESF